MFVESFGGAEKVACNMANEFVTRGHEVVLLCNDYKQGMPAYPLDNRVTFVNLNGQGHRLEQYPFKLKFLRELGRALKINPVFHYAKAQCQHIRAGVFREKIEQLLQREQPDALIPFFLSDLNMLMACESARKIPTILMVHDDPRKVFLHITAADRKALQHCQMVQVLLPEYIHTAEKRTKRPVVAIPNAIDMQDAPVQKDQPTYRIIHVGRLDREQKRQHLLVEAFAKIANDFPDWTVHCFGGDTPLHPGYHKRLEQLISKHHLESRFILEGESPCIRQELRNSDIFAFPSSHEGFSLAMLEAMAVGLPCIGFNNAPGVKELIRNENNGLLVPPTTTALASGLRRLMASLELRKNLGKAAVELSRKFAPQAVWNQWEQQLMQITGNNKKFVASEDKK